MIGILTLLVRALVVLLMVRLVGRFVAAAVRGYRGAGVRLAPDELVRDRVCNTFLPRARAVLGTVDGREEPFCSVTCRDRALAGVAGVGVLPAGAGPPRSA